MSATTYRRDGRVRDDGAARSRRVAPVLVVVTAALLLGGCRGDAPVTPPTAPSGSATGAGAAPADPLAGVESAVDAVDRAVDEDAGAAGR